jgi:NDP-sugar pyrophosphorylase family protein
MSKELKQAMVLAHGVGEDCFPYGGEKSPRPKYAFEVANVPLVKRVIDQLLALGMERICVVAGFQGHVIQGIVNQSYGGRPVEVIMVDNYRAGDAIVALSAARKANLRGNLMIVNGDLLAFESDYRGLVNAFAEVGGAYPVALYDELGDEEDKPSWHTAEISSDGKRIARVRGRVEDGKYRLTGMYAIDANSLSMSSQIPMSMGQPMYIAAAMQEAMANGIPIGAVRAQDDVVHVDRCFDYLDANQTVLMRELRAITERKGAYVYRAPSAESGQGGDGDPDPEFIFPGTIISPGATVVCEEGAFIGPYETREQHLEAIKRLPRPRATRSARSASPGQASAAQDRAGTSRRAAQGYPVVPIRIRGDLYLGKGSRVGLNALLEGSIVVGENSYIEDSVVEKGVLIGSGVGVRRHAVVRSLTVCGDRSRFECAADFQGVAGPGTIWMHPGQCWVVTGRNCDFGAGNFVGTWRFDSGRCEFRISNRVVKPGKDRIANASYLGDDVRTGVGVFLAPGTRIGADSLLGIGMFGHGTYEAGYFYSPKQEVVKLRVGFVRPHKKK